MLVSADMIRVLYVMCSWVAKLFRLLVIVLR